METFTYRAMDSQGRIVSGRLDSQDAAELEARLRRTGLELIRGTRTRQPAAWRRRPVSRRALIHLCFQLEQLLRAGVPILEGLQDLSDNLPAQRLKQIVGDVVMAIEGGNSLSQALERHPDTFDHVFLSLVRAGEYSGCLPDTLHALSDALKRDDELHAHARRVVIYPAIVSMILMAALGVSLVYVVPELARLFQTAGIPLPWQTRWLIALSDLLVRHGTVLAFSVGAALLVLRRALHHPAVRLQRDTLLLALPIVGPLLGKISLARCCNLLALMYASGITLLDALRAAEKVVGNRALQLSLRSTTLSIEEGQSVSEAFAAASLFPPLVTRMLRVGERTGALDQALSNVRYFYDRDIREAIERIEASIEPTLTLLLGGLLAGIMSAVMMPAYDILTRLAF